MMTMDKAALQQEIVKAMKAKDKVRLSALRQVMQSVKNTEIDRREEATEADVTAAIRKLIKVTGEEADALSKSPAGREERIGSLRRQVGMLEELLPAQVSGAELEGLVTQGISEVGATTRRDTGKVMGWLTKRTDGNFDKPSAAKLIGEALS
jgi:uncharacterized protein YqeY